MKYGKFLKRGLALAMILALLLSMTACGASKSEPLTDILTDTAALLMETAAEPVYGSVGGEWVALGFARWGGEVPQTWYDAYYRAVENYVDGCDGVLSDRKYTEYSRVILALTAIGKDPRNVGGYDLLYPLADFEQTTFQGVNGAIYALLALDSGNYDIPENTSGTTQATRDLYISHVLEKELPGGGWSFAGSEVEIDITAMALQALAKYTDRQDVSAAVERALVILSEQQNENGGYTAYNTESSETVSQVIVALAELGISLDDPRFMKNDKTLLDALLRFRQADGGFSHMSDGKTDILATEQAFYALVAANRMAKRESSLYRMK